MKHKQNYKCPNCSGKIHTSSLGVVKCSGCNMFFDTPTYVDESERDRNSDWSDAYRMFEMDELSDEELQIISDKQHAEVQKLINEQFNTKTDTNKAILKRITKKYLKVK